MKIVNLKYLARYLTNGAFIAALIIAPTLSQSAQSSSEKGKDLVVQTFQNGPLHIEYRYVGNDLHYISIVNTKDDPIVVDVLGEHYTLGKNDRAIFSPPNVRVIHYRYTLYSPFQTVASNLLTNRFSDTFIYKLPAQTNSVTSK